MAKMKTVTIDGEKYIVSDPDAVLYTPQTLTPEQKAQARGNIGIDPLIGTTEEITPAQVAEAITQGRSIAITYGGVTLSSFLNLNGLLVAHYAMSFWDGEQNSAVSIGSVCGDTENNEWYEGDNLLCPKKEYVDEQIGNIETALDGILAIQNQLIGGDGV